MIRAVRFALLGEDEPGTNLAHLVYDGAPGPRAQLKVILRFRSDLEGVIEVQRVRDHVRSGDKRNTLRTDRTVRLGDGVLHEVEASEWLESRFLAALLQYFVFDAHQWRRSKYPLGRSIRFGPQRDNTVVVYLKSPTT